MFYSELVEKLAARWDMDYQRAGELTELLFSNIKKIVNTEGRLEIRGFGVFEARERKQSSGRIPGTGREVDIPPRRVPVFKAGKKLKEEAREIPVNDADE